MKNETGFTPVPYCPLSNPIIHREAPTPSGWDSDYWVREDGRVINYYGCGHSPPPGQILYQPGWATPFGWPEINNNWSYISEGKTDGDGRAGAWRIKYLLKFIEKKMGHVYIVAKIVLPGRFTVMTYLPKIKATIHPSFSPKDSQTRRALLNPSS